MILPSCRNLWILSQNFGTDIGLSNCVAYGLHLKSQCLQNLLSSLKNLHHGACWFLIQWNSAVLSEPTCTITSQIRPTTQISELYIFPPPSVVTAVSYFRAQSHRNKRLNYFQEQRFANHNAFQDAQIGKLVANIKYAISIKSECQNCVLSLSLLL
jgi:hypothetical protein